MRQQSMLRHALVPAAIFAVFAAPAAAQAAPVDNGSPAASPVKLRALTAPPREALAGDSFRVTASVRNMTDRTIRPRLTVTLRKARSASGRTLATRRLARIKPGKTLKQRMRVRVPRTTATGRYYVAACVRLNRRRSCRVAGRRVNVLRATTAPAPPPAPPAPVPVTPPARYNVLAFTESATGEHPATDDAVAALRALGRDNGFRVSSPRARTASSRRTGSTTSAPCSS